MEKIANNVIELGEKKRQIEERIKSGEYFQSGKYCKFKKEVRALAVPSEEEMGGMAGIPFPVRISPGLYKCLGFLEQERLYRFYGRPKGEDEDSEFLVHAEDFLEK